MRTPSLAPAYVFVAPIIAEAAQEHGYAVAIHGSLQRDLDLVAIPWTEKAADTDTVLQAILKAVDGFLVKVPDHPEPTFKPHGRLTWSVHLDGGVFIDLSIMPRL